MIIWLHAGSFDPAAKGDSFVTFRSRGWVMYRQLFGHLCEFLEQGRGQISLSKAGQDGDNELPLTFRLLCDLSIALGRSTKLSQRCCASDTHLSSRASTSIKVNAPFSWNKRHGLPFSPHLFTGFMNWHQHFQLSSFALTSPMCSQSNASCERCL